MGQGQVTPMRLKSSAGRWAVAATVLGSGAVFLESTVMTVALPAIGRDLDLGLAGLQWLLNAYLLPLSALILLGGSLGDRYGRRRVFVVGLIGFATGSALVHGRARLSDIGGLPASPGNLRRPPGAQQPRDPRLAVRRGGPGCRHRTVGRLVGRVDGSGPAGRRLARGRALVALGLCLRGAIRPRGGVDSRPKNARRQTLGRGNGGLRRGGTGHARTGGRHGRVRRRARASEGRPARPWPAAGASSSWPPSFWSNATPVIRCCRWGCFAPGSSRVPTS